MVPPLLWSSFPILDLFILKTEKFRPSESSVTLHQLSRRNFTQELNLHKQVMHFETLNAHRSCSSSYRLYVRDPNAVDVDCGNFLAPFNVSLWLGILVVILVVSVLLEACHRLNRHFGSCHVERRYQPALQDSLYQVLSAFCSQGMNSDNFVKFPSRFSKLLWMVSRMNESDGPSLQSTVSFSFIEDAVWETYWIK